MAGNDYLDWLCCRIVQESGDAIIFADREGIIRLWNKGAQDIFGYTADEALGADLNIIIPANLRARHREGYQRVMAGGSSRYTTGVLAVPGLRRDLSRVSLEFSITLVRDDQGEILGIAAILRDVTARWEREKELKGRLQALERDRQPAGDQKLTTESGD